MTIDHIIQRQALVATLNRVYLDRGHRTASEAAGARLDAMDGLLDTYQIDRDAVIAGAFYEYLDERDHVMAVQWAMGKLPEHMRDALQVHANAFRAHLAALQETPKLWGPLPTHRLFDRSPIDSAHGRKKVRKANRI